MAVTLSGVLLLASLGACQGPSDERKTLALRIDGDLLSRKWAAGPRQEAAEAEVRKSARKFVSKLWGGEPMPKGTPAGSEAATEQQVGLDPALEAAVRKAPQPPGWTQGSQEPPRSADHDLPRAWPVAVRQGETLHLLAQWAGSDAKTLRDDNRERLGRRKWLRVGDRLELTMSANQKFAFDQSREQFASSRVEAYFSKRSVAKVVVYRVKRNVSIATDLKRYGDVPLWLLQEFNQTDFRTLQPNDELLVPVVVKYISRKTAPPTLVVVDEEENPLTGEALERIRERLDRNGDLLGRARLAVDDSNVFERGGGHEAVRAEAAGVLPRYEPLPEPVAPVAAVARGRHGRPLPAAIAAAAPAHQALPRGATPGPRPPGPSAALPSEALPSAAGSARGRADEIQPRRVVVRPGETLSHYVGWAGLSLRRIQDANPSLDPNRMSVGKRVVLPLSDSDYATFVTRRSGDKKAKAKAVKDAAALRKAKTYVVRSGDTASAIAKRHKTSVGRLRRTNPDRDLNQLRVGSKIRLP